MRKAGRTARTQKNTANATCGRIETDAKASGCMALARRRRQRDERRDVTTGQQRARTIRRPTPDNTSYRAPEDEAADDHCPRQCTNRQRQAGGPRHARTGRRFGFGTVSSRAVLSRPQRNRIQANQVEQKDTGTECNTGSGHESRSVAWQMGRTRAARISPRPCRPRGDAQRRAARKDPQAPGHRERRRGAAGIADGPASAANTRDTRAATPPSVAPAGSKGGA